MNRPKGWSKAKFDSYVGLRRNPNQYFYRHTAPGVEQSSGEWTSDEIDTFLKIAREFGCGDKFGLFASYLEHRVGYQVTAFYKSHFLSKGIIFDDNYRLNTQGTVVYVGK
ncbi:hypothetical protein EDD86DRAFT_203659 [Gorgonomyces haynaldii]|nr:hypothetical protein EDD86DRAFT_203659 [Gorgonomyces haynaldii]